MQRTNQVNGICPVCGNDMVISRLSCGNCGSALEGSFTLREHSTDVQRNVTRSDRSVEAHFGRLARLDDLQLEFVEAFLRCRGIIKNVEDMLGISYPTVRARLNDALDAMGFTGDDESPAPDDRRARREILADLAAGRITTEKAHTLLRRTASAMDVSDEDGQG